MDKEFWSTVALQLHPAYAGLDVEQCAFKRFNFSGSHRVAIDIIFLLFPIGNLYFLYAPLSKRKSGEILSLGISLG